MAALYEEEISLDRLITIELDQVSLKNALELILHKARLTYVIKDEMLEITTESHANGNTTSRSGLFLEPALPPLDPKVVEALQKVLAESETPDVPRLIIEVEEPAVEEEQEGLPGWLRLCVPLESPIRNLFIEPAPSDLILKSDEPSAGEEQEGSEMEHDLLYYDFCAFRGLDADIDLDISYPQGLRVRCEVQIAGRAFRLLWDKGGCVSFTVSVVADSAEDLRAAQWEHNEQVIRWIEEWNDDGVRP
jgi:hypothetical protein